MKYISGITYIESCRQDFIFHQLSTNKLKELLVTFFLNRYNSQTLRMYLKIVNLILLWSLFQISPFFGSAIWELSTVSNKQIFELLQCEYVSLLRLDKMGNFKLVQHFHLSPIMFFLLFILVFDLDMS